MDSRHAYVWLGDRLELHISDGLAYRIKPTKNMESSRPNVTFEMSLGD